MEFDRITAKKSFNGIILIFILYNVLFYLIHEAVSMGYAIYVVGARPDINYEELLNLVFNTGFALIAASTFPTLLAFVIAREKPDFGKTKTIGIKGLIMFFVVMQGIQLICTLMLVPLEGLFYQAGYNFEAASSAASDPSIYFSSLLYSVAVAPLMEELFFRGLILKKLRPYGKTFAILVAAMLFSLMHQNIVQLPVTFLMGVLFGYIAVEYSLGAAIALHVLNNAFVEVTGHLMNRIEYLWIADSLFMYVCAAVSAVLLVINLKNIGGYFNSEKPASETVKCFFKRPLTIITIVYFLFMTVMSVSVI